MRKTLYGLVMLAVIFSTLQTLSGVIVSLSVDNTSYLNVAADTEYHAYGQAAEALTVSNPAQAVQYADSPKYFAENNPPLETAAYTFADVPDTYWAWSYIERLYNAGITGGCSTSPLMYCPLNPVTRAQMAIFILRGMHGSAYVPPAATGAVFGDVPLGSFAADWIEQLAAEGITAGCGGGNYCPDANITRAQMAVFLLRGEHGSAYVPPTATGTIFSDVPLGSFAVDWIEQLALEGITGGCGAGIYCPNANVTRDQMAVFLVRAFQIVGNFYVSPNGSDTNPGTQAQPWQTLTQVNNHNFLPGDVIHFQSGSTWVGGLLIDNSGLQGKPITFTTYGTGAKPIITNPGSLTNLTNAIKINADWVVVEGLMVSNAQYMGVYIANGSDNNIVRDIEAANVGIGIQIRGQHNLVTKNYIHDLHMVVNTPGGNDDYGAIGISFSDGSYNEVSYNRIVRCKVPSYDFVTDGGIVEFYGHSDSNYIHHNWGSDSNVFIEVGGGSAIDDILAYNVSVNNGHFSSIHLNGTWASVVSNFRVENNTIVENGGSGWVIFGFIGDPTSGTFSLRNNVVYVSGFQNVSNKSGFTHVNNLYYLGGGTQLGFDLGSGEVIADPLFVNLAAQDVHL